MSTRNLYVRTGDESFWNWAEDEAKKAGVALSVWVTRLIRNHKIGLSSGVEERRAPADLLELASNQIDEAIAELRREPES